MFGIVEHAGFLGLRPAGLVMGYQGPMLGGLRRWLIWRAGD